VNARQGGRIPHQSPRSIAIQCDENKRKVRSKE
jgi:hypothetical protein